MNRIREFSRELIQYLKERGYETSEVFCVKNNGEKDGIVFHNKSTFSPIFYLEELYEQYNKGVTIPKLAEGMLQQLPIVNETEAALQEVPIMNLLHDYPHMRENLRLCMVSKSSNEALLAETPHRDYGDFSAVVYWIPETENNISIRMLLKDEVVNKMQINFDTAFRDAYINMMGEFELKSIEDMLYEVIVQKLKADEMADIPAEDYIHRMSQGMEWYLLTHKSGIFGSAAICYQRELAKAADRIGGDYIIIPASIHDLLLVPFNKNVPLEAIRELIRQINEEQLEQEERLAENAYVYSIRDSCIMCDREYLQKKQIEQTNELHQRSEYEARDEWRDDRCLM